MADPAHGYLFLEGRLFFLHFVTWMLIFLQMAGPIFDSWLCTGLWCVPGPIYQARNIHSIQHQLDWIVPTLYDVRYEPSSRKALRCWLLSPSPVCGDIFYGLLVSDAHLVYEFRISSHNHKAFSCSL